MESIPQEQEEVKQEECVVEHCHEPRFRDGELCFHHFIEEEDAEWDAWTEDRRAQLASIGCF